MPGQTQGGPVYDPQRLPAWQLIGLGLVSVAGAGIGAVALPAAAPVVAVAATVQLAATAVGLVAARHPLLWAVAVAAAALVSSLGHPFLAELTVAGGSPWPALATLAAVLNLYLRAADRRALVAGSGALVLGAAGTVVIGAAAGVPITTAVLASSVHFLIGVVIAFALQLRAARADRVRRPAQVPPGDPAAGELTAARRALSLVALRLEELASVSSDPSARRAAADLQEVSQRALGRQQHELPTSPREAHQQTSPSPGPPASPEAVVPAAPPEPDDLTDREREVLRLVATGATNAAIARSLYLSEATVKQYVSRLMRRFECQNRTQLALLASRWFPVRTSEPPAHRRHPRATAADGPADLRRRRW